MATRKSFVELIVPESTIARGANTVGGTVIGDYLVDGHRVVVVKMPKVEKKAPAKKAKKAATTKVAANNDPNLGSTKWKGRADPDIKVEMGVTHGA